MYTTVGFLNTSLEMREFSERGNLASGFSPVGDIQVSLQYINGTARGSQVAVTHVYLYSVTTTYPHS